ncbi:polysaccharide export protein EpsE [Ampullimonas aquatilis]|uniref:polysaccharide export protein EpsE n=1 Tax=Ampullimonas aquatilis TaxID=1341549 RepID=UPI003C792DF1
MFRRLFICLVTALLTSAALAPAQAVAQAQRVDSKAEYIIGSGDGMKINVFQSPDLSVEVRVSENGTISYPLLGQVALGGLTITAAEQKIAQLLKDGGFVNKPQVNILLLQVRGNQVSVLGQVNKPGRYPLEMANMRLSEVLAMAGGILPTGEDFVVITGQRDSKPIRLEIDFAGIFLSGKTERDIVIAANDVIYVHRAPLFYIYGEVQRAGSYRVEREMTVQQAVAQGGGLTQRGTEKGLRLSRRNASGAIQTMSPDMNEKIQPNDVLYVKESLF